MKSLLVILLFAVSLYIAFSIFEKKAHAAGYAQAWSDAQCGKGQECEAGQE